MTDEDKARADHPSVQFTGENHDEICAFVGPMLYRFHPSAGLRILSGNAGVLSVSPGDWVVKDSPMTLAVIKSGGDVNA